MVTDKIPGSKTKRKTSESSTDKIGVASKKRKTTKCDSESYNDDGIFCQLMEKVRLHLKSGKASNEIGCDQAVLQKNLQSAIKRHPNHPDAPNTFQDTLGKIEQFRLLSSMERIKEALQVIDEFIDGFTNYIDDKSRLYYALLPSSTTADCTSARGGTQDCLVRILLGIEILQPKLMNCLLEKLVEFTTDDENIFEHGERVNLPHILLNQFRWLDQIVNGKEITDKMLEMIEVVNPDIQRALITCLPEVVEDSEHGRVAMSLREMMLQSSELTVPILDALSNLTLRPELLSEIQGSVLQTLASVEIENLPVVIKFLLHSVNNTDALEVVSEIRNNLDFSATFPPARSSTPHDSTSHRGPHPSGDVQSGAKALTLEAIKSGIRFRKCVAEAWIKAIDGVKIAADHKVMDVMVCIILHSTGRTKPVESLFRNKIRCAGFTELLLQAAFGTHAEVMRDFFPSILCLSEVLLRSAEEAIIHFASAMYKHAFVSFDTYCQQEIVGNLVMHIGSGFDGEVDSSLDILSELVDKNLKQMAPFAIFVKGVLDYIDNLSVGQIRKLYSMLSVLAFRNPENGGLIQDDLHIIIRKQLSNDNAKYKRMGIIGAIMVVKSIAYNSGNVEASQSSPEELSEGLYKQVVSLLQLVKTSSSTMSEASALFMDELSGVVQEGHLHPKVEEWITEYVTSDFQDDYIVDLTESQEKGLIPCEQKFGLDDESEGSIAIPLTALTEKSHRNKKKQKNKASSQSTGHIVDPVCLPSHFRLLRMCEQRQAGTLENIDALLGCPLCITKDDVYQKLEPLSTKEKDVICESLFHTLNWFREVINAFATQSDVEMKGKVISRLQNISEMQNILEKCLSVHPGFQPPPATFDWYDSPVVHVSPAQTTNGKKKDKKPSKKKKGDKENVPDEDGDESSRDTTVLDKTALPETQNGDAKQSSDKAFVNLSNYRPFFRELDMEVFSILNTGMITKSNLDTEMNTKATTELTIGPEQLEFLLDDLSRKLSHSLIAATSKRKCFLKPKLDKNVGFCHLDQLNSAAVAAKAVKLLSAVCDHLEGASGYFQTLIEENDGLMDGPGSFSSQSTLMGNCFHLLLQILLSVISWNGFIMTENRELLKEVLETIALRIKSSTATQVGFQELMKCSFQYFENFAETVPNLKSGITLVKLLSTLAEKSDLPNLTSKITKVCENFLKREWFGPDGEKEKGAKHNENLQVILKTYLVKSPDILAVAEAIATKGIPELIETDKNGSSSTYPTLTRSSFPLFYRALFIELVDCVKGISPSKASDTSEERLDKLLKWNQAVRILHILINLIKAFDARSNLGSALKYGRQFIEIFLRQGMPLLDQMFRGHRDDVQGLLKNLQLSTRNLHHMCGHSKIVKDIALTNQVPLLKKCLEAFVYRVKAMLTLNKCLEAFWLGNLKNKDLRGEEIVSQSTVADDESSVGNPEEDQGELEEECSDVELDDQSDAGDEGSRDGNTSDDDSRSIQY